MLRNFALVLLIVVGLASFVGAKEGRDGPFPIVASEGRWLDVKNEKQVVITAEAANSEAMKVSVTVYNLEGTKVVAVGSAIHKMSDNDLIINGQDEQGRAIVADFRAKYLEDHKNAPFMLDVTVRHPGVDQDPDSYSLQRN